MKKLLFTCMVLFFASQTGDLVGRVKPLPRQIGRIVVGDKKNIWALVGRAAGRLSRNHGPSSIMRCNILCKLTGSQWKRHPRPAGAIEDIAVGSDGILMLVLRGKKINIGPKSDMKYYYPTTIVKWTGSKWVKVPSSLKK